MYHMYTSRIKTGKCRQRQSNALSVVLFLSALFPSMALQAQSSLGGFTGAVSDASGAKIAKATVTAKDTTTNFETKTTTNSSGEYTIPLLTPDTYTITVEVNGFGPQSKTDLVLTAGGNVKADFQMTVGAVDQKVIVTSEGAQLDTQSANLAMTLSAKEVTDTPNVGRNPFVFATLAPGVQSGAYMQSQASSFATAFGGTAVQIVVNGNAGHIRLTLNGIPDDPAERLSGAVYTGFVPSPEAVQEVKTQTTLLDAQYGHGAAVLNTVLRSGANNYHGSGYYVFRNTYLDANQYQRVPNQNGALNSAAPTHRLNDQWQEPGFVLDGPLGIPWLYNAHDKTFFMVAYERIQSKSPVPYTTSALLPTDAQRSGDFSGLCTTFANGVCVPGAGVQIYDPLTADSAGNRTPFLGNIIPSNRINPVGAALIQYYPKPNTTTGGPGVNYIAPITTFPQKYFSFVARIDHSFSESNKINGTFFKAILNQIQPNNGFPKAIGITGSDYTVYRNNAGGTIEDVQVLSPTLVLDARLGVIYHPFGLIYKGLTFDTSSLGISSNGLPYQSFPGTSFSDNYAGLAAGAGGQVSTDAVVDPAVLISKTLKAHNIRVGFELNATRYNVQNSQSGFGTFAFNRQFTQRNSTCGLSTCTVGGDSSSGNALASLLLGNPSSGSYGINIAYALQQLYYTTFVQDDWRVNSKLTLNAGLRWDYESPFTERYNRLNTGFCFSCTSPLQAGVPSLKLVGGLQFAGADNRHPYPSDFNTLQPRIGVAYQFSPSTVLRGGYALTYLDTLESPLAQGFTSSTSYVASTDGTHPANNLSNPFPSGATVPNGSSLGLATQLGQGVNYNDQDHRQPRMMQYTVSTQTQLPGQVVLQIAYVGEKSSRLEVNKSMNGLPLQYYNQGTAGVTFLQQQVPNPFAGQLPGSSLNAGTIQRQFLLTPYPQFTSVTDNYSSVGSQNYNSLQLYISKRLSHHFSLQSSFTWLKEMDRNIYLNSGQDAVGALFRYRDSTPSLIGNVIGSYQFASLAARPRWERAILGGWQINGVLRAQNGSLVSSPSNVTLLSNPHLSNATYSQYFNTCYLTAAGTPVVGPGACASNSSTPAFQQHLAFTQNNIGPLLDGVRQRVHPLLDTSLFKVFKIHESQTFEIRGEFFNTLNTPNFGAPGTSLGTATYGTVTLTQANDPRLTTLTARINF